MCEIHRGLPPGGGFGFPPMGGGGGPLQMLLPLLLGLLGGLMGGALGGGQQGGGCCPFGQGNPNFGCPQQGQFGGGQGCFGLNLQFRAGIGGFLG